MFLIYSTGRPSNTKKNEIVRILIVSLPYQLDLESFDDLFTTE